MVPACASRQSAFPALDNYLRAHRRWALGFVLSRVKSPDIAEEVVQDAALEAFRYRHSYDCDRPIEPWFRRILLHQCAKRMGRNARLPCSLTPLTAGDSEYLTEAMCPSMLSESAEAAVIQVLEHERLGEWIKQGLSRLSVAEQELLADVYLREVDRKALAASLGITMSALGVRLYSARRRLRAALELHDAEESGCGDDRV